MLCVSCGHDNPDGSKYCGKCNAVLPQMAPTGVPGGQSTLDLEEDTEYPTPQGRYISEIMHALTWTSHEFLEEGADLDPLLECIEDVKARFEEFQENIPTILESLANQQAAVPEDPYPKQMRYLNNIGVQKYEQGLALVDQFLAGLENDTAEADTLVNGINLILDGNDHLCLCIEMTAVRISVIEQGLDLHQRGENLEKLAEARQAAIEAAAAQLGAQAEAAPEQEPTEEPTVVPVDSTEVG